MAIVLVFILGITILVILGFFAVNKWSSLARDREKSAGMRANRQMAGSERENRGTGIN
jgi:hypothetical protein